MANTRSLKPNMSPRSSAGQIRKVPTVDNATAFSALVAATCVFRDEHLVDASVGAAAILSSEPHDAGGRAASSSGALRRRLSHRASASRATDQR